MFYSNIEQLCASKGIKISNLCDTLHISRGNIARWKTGTIPTAEKLKLVADFFDVTTDYLLTGSDNKKVISNTDNAIPEEVSILARKMGNIPESQRERIYRLLDATIDNVLEALDNEERH